MKSPVKPPKMVRKPKLEPLRFIPTGMTEGKFLSNKMYQHELRAIFQNPAGAAFFEVLSNLHPTTDARLSEGRQLGRWEQWKDTLSLIDRLLNTQPVEDEIAQEHLPYERDSFKP